MKLLSALRDIDEGKAHPLNLTGNKGYVRQRVFFNLLDCLDFRISDETKTQILKDHSADEKQQTVIYEPVVNRLWFFTEDKQSIAWKLKPFKSSQKKEATSMIEE